MAVSEEALGHVLDLFRGLGPIRTGRMFSGVGLFVEDDVMFAMIAGSGTVFLKSDATTEDRLRDAGSEPFTYARKGGEQQITSFMSLPDSAFDDPDEAMDWARLSLEPARAAAERKRAEKARKAARGR
ncbi:TfoX/Sxy family protein [Pseudooceanicola onchidii]|uniref:TfoX/Sxy family protein n=1 Tax=Pseudooceanicola onchidii TaxID=2562279 RepID=UPI0010AA88CF|nr:TfoX/Sxy family protein [Pseudooceanicola onchidii]